MKKYKIITLFKRPKIDINYSDNHFMSDMEENNVKNPYTEDFSQTDNIRFANIVLCVKVLMYL